jgi:hypothetical protein
MFSWGYAVSEGPGRAVVFGHCAHLLLQRSTVNWREVERFCVFPITRCPDHRITRFLQPSACVPQPETPPPITLCCKQRLNPNSKGLSTELSKPFFAFFGGRIRPNFSLLFPFLLFGRQRAASAQSRAAHQSPRLKSSS